MVRKRKMDRSVEVAFGVSSSLCVTALYCCFWPLHHGCCIIDVLTPKCHLHDSWPATVTESHSA